MKKILIVWSFVAVFLICGLTYIGLHIKKQNEPYQKLEKELEKQAMSLIGEKPIYGENNSKITIEDFKNNNYEIELKTKNDNCLDGYVLIEKSMGFLKYTGYIKCKNYTTHGYKN